MAVKRCIFAAALLVLFFSAFTPVPLLAQNVSTQVTPGQDFSKFTKYGWRENMIAPAALPEERKAVEKKIKEVVNRELTKKGYTEDPQNPDFFIEVRAAAMPGELTTSANLATRVPEGSDVFSSTYPNGPGVNILLTMTGGARITVTDAASNATAWEALVTKKYKNPDKAKRNLDKEIESLFTKGLKGFPPRKSRS
jgi:hypothetical protein